MPEDTRRHFYWGSVDALRRLMREDLAYKCKSTARVTTRTTGVTGDYILREGNIKFTIIDPGMSSRGYYVYSDDLMRVRMALIRALKYINDNYETREVAKPILPQEIFDNLQEWVFDFYKAIAELQTTRGFGNVGIILQGPAGVGKSETMRWLREVADEEYDRSSWQISMADLSQMLANATPLNADHPLILIDDIDVNILRDRREMPNPMVSQFLTCLDGLDKREGRVFVVSTNEKIDNIDPALVRPGRFEHILHYEYPDYNLIVQFCNQREITVDPSKFEGWSFARVDMFHAKWRVANYLHGTTQDGYYEKFIHSYGEPDPTVEAYSEIDYK